LSNQQSKWSAVPTTTELKTLQNKGAKDGKGRIYRSG
jgi:hypothetical protein